MGHQVRPEYVNRLYAMVRRHLSGDFRFVCLTDSTEGFAPSGVLSHSRPEHPSGPASVMALEEAHHLRARPAWPQGSGAVLDLDVVIVGSLDEFFTARRLPHHATTRVSGALANALSATPRSTASSWVPMPMCWSISRTCTVRGKYRNEQEYLFLHKQGKLDYWPAAWCPSFKYYCIPTWPTNYWKEPVPPADARIVIFHGEVNPPDALEGRRNKRFRHIEPARWIEKAWG
jgi:hypothetical protein